MFIPPAGFTAGATSTKYWVIFIHGGAWRDPTIGAAAFVPTCKQLLTSPLLTHVAVNIEGYASLDYRLSVHPDYPQDASSLDTFLMREARHPDHVIGIITGISVLQRKYDFGSRYILVGHSCGATMALQSVMRLNEVENRALSWTPPQAILGAHGIYDIPALIRTFSEIPEYRDSVVGAFGEDERVWETVSPAHGDWLSSPNAWGADGKTLLVIAHSSKDELVDWHQSELMAQKVQSVWKEHELQAPQNERDTQNVKCLESKVPDRSGNFALAELQTAHHEVWETGWELGRTIALVLNGLKRLRQNQRPFEGHIQTITRTKLFPAKCHDTWLGSKASITSS